MIKSSEVTLALYVKKSDTVGTVRKNRRGLLKNIKDTKLG